MMKSQKKSREESDLEEIRKGFEMFDTNGTGLVNPSEIKEAMESMNMPEKNPFIYEIISSLSTSDDIQYKNGISIDDLVNYVYEKVNDSESNLGLKQLFDALKDPGTNTISMHTFMKLAKDYEEDDFSGDELRYLLEKTQLGGDELTFEEFCTIMKGGMSSASIRSEEPDYDKKNVIQIDNENTPQEIKEINESNKIEENNTDNIIMDEENKDNINYKVEEVEIKNPEINNNEVMIQNQIENNFNDDNNNNKIEIIIEKSENKKDEEIKSQSIPNSEKENIIKDEINFISPIPQIKIEEESVKKEEPKVEEIIIEQKINIEKEEPKKEEKPQIEEKILIESKPKIEEKHEIVEENIIIEQKPKEEEKPKETVKPGRFRRWTKNIEKPKEEEKPKVLENIEIKEEKTIKRGNLTYNRDVDNNNNKIVEIKTTEIKEEKPVKKYNRFRRFNINKDNNDVGNNKNNEIRTSNNKPEFEKKEVIEEKTTITKKVYKTRRPFNVNNNVEDKKEEKVEVTEKKESEVPRRYHRRYRENKNSSNTGV